MLPKVPRRSRLVLRCHAQTNLKKERERDKQKSTKKINIKKVEKRGMYA